MRRVEIMIQKTLIVIGTGAGSSARLCLGPPIRILKFCP